MASDVPTMKSTTLPMADMMDEYRNTSKGCRYRLLSVIEQLLSENICKLRF